MNLPKIKDYKSVQCISIKKIFPFVRGGLVGRLHNVPNV
jgi:hypothetical protein